MGEAGKPAPRAVPGECHILDAFPVQRLQRPAEPVTEETQTGRVPEVRPSHYPERGSFVEDASPPVVPEEVTQGLVDVVVLSEFVLGWQVTISLRSILSSKLPRVREAAASLISDSRIGSPPSPS